jgi:GrpB-like predicted nucleotidyltransferase (UPF0157 family)
MENNYIIWNEYLHDVQKKIEKLIDSKEKIYTDFHMHSDYSADGKQSLREIIKRTKDLGLDIIAITDHDSIKVYDDLYELLKNEDYDGPIIVPGVEFTTENHEYGSQCHILQLMINPKEQELLNDIAHNDRAAWIRVNKQFERIAHNKTLQYFFKRCDIKCSIERYKRYLATLARPIPEYTTLLDYLMSILKEKGITTWEVFKKLEDYNAEDKCEERRQLKEKRYDVLRKKYSEKGDVDYNTRFLLSLLAVKGVDDDYFPEYESCGSLSVNNFDEITIEKINHKHLTIFAHPNEDKLYFMNKAFEINTNICGMEMNKQSVYSDNKVFYDKAKELNAITIIGSDSHSLDSTWYDDMEFYVADKNELRRFIEKAKEYFVVGISREEAFLTTFSDTWKLLYEEQKNKIMGMVEKNILDIAHVGSTSIPGLSAKPIIDMAVAVSDLNDVFIQNIKKGDKYYSMKDLMVEAGYGFRDDNGVKGEYLFYLGDENLRTHYIHVVPKTGKRWNDYMDFKSFMLSHPDKVVEYEMLKKDLSLKYPNERKVYTESKNEFISNVLNEARKNK